MLDDETIEQHIRDLMIAICAVMFQNGYRELPIGPMMRLIGVDDESASKHDDEWIELTDEFLEFVDQHDSGLQEKSAPPGATLH